MTLKTPAKAETLPSKTHYNTYLTALIAALLVFGITAYLASKGKPMGWETSLFRKINDWPNGGLATFFKIVTFFGSTWMALIAVIAVFATRAYRLAWRLALTIVGAYGVAYIAKHFVGRVRPMELLTNVHVRATETGMGFPSGHATLSTVIALTIWPYIPTKAKYVLVPLFIALVALSRLYLGVHFPMDVIGGIAVGVGAVSFVRVLPTSFRKLLRVY